MRQFAGRLTVGLLFVLMPLSAHAAAANFFGPVIPEACKCTTSAPGWGCVLETAQNSMDLGVTFSVFIAVFLMAYGGVMLVFNPTNPENISKARSMLVNAIIGIIIVLAAWLVVDSLMKLLYDPSTFGPWNNILAGGDQCVMVQPVHSIFTGPILGTQPDGSGGVVTTSPGGTSVTPTTPGSGACQIPQSGNCAPANLTAFGSAAQQASEICYAESRGVVNSASGSDKMRNDPQRRSFSFGLFQINLTQHNVGGLPCPSAFNGKNYTATVRDESLYSRCVAAAETASANIAEAVATQHIGGWGLWSTASQCRLASTEPLQLFAERLSSEASSFGLPSLL